MSLRCGRFVVVTEDADLEPHAGRAQVRAAERGDVGTILAMIRELAEFEKLTHLCTATADQLTVELFGPDAAAEALVAVAGSEAVGYAIFFHNFSTFLGRRGLYLEDLY